MRIAAAYLAALLAPIAAVPAAVAKELKPKFGDIGGIYYTAVSGHREACRQAIRNKIVLCHRNTEFGSGTRNRKYPGCLPVFERQARNCVVHFRAQMRKCNFSGSARITDFTGFGCTVTKRVAESSGARNVAPANRRMQARTKANVHSGPGTNYRKVGTLLPGQNVRVTGETRDWLRIEQQDGKTAFVHSSLLRQDPQPAQSEKRSRPRSIVAENQLCAVWNPNPNYYKSAIWSGGCHDGKASGSGRLVWRHREGQDVYDGNMHAGRANGRGTIAWANGDRYEGKWWKGRHHGRGLLTFADGIRYEGEWWNGRISGPAVQIDKSGRRTEGRAVDGCFGERGGVWVNFGKSARACGFK